MSEERGRALLISRRLSVDAFEFQLLRYLSSKKPLCLPILGKNDSLVEAHIYRAGALVFKPDISVDGENLSSDCH